MRKHFSYLIAFTIAFICLFNKDIEFKIDMLLICMVYSVDYLANKIEENGRN